MPQLSQDNRLKWVNHVSELMDSRFTIPGTSVRFGLDPILGLIPGLGDLSTYSVSLALIYTMFRHGASGLLVAKMLANATLDLVIGSIPILGIVFDFFFKANNRNVKLLREYYHEEKHQGSGRRYVACVLVLVILATAGLIYLIWQLIAAIIEFVFVCGLDLK